MRGPEWDMPKQLEIAKIERLQAKTDVAADDPSVELRSLLGFSLLLRLLAAGWTGRLLLRVSLDVSVTSFD